MPSARPGSSPNRGMALRQSLAGLLVALLAALSPVLSAAPAGAARVPGRTAPATSTATAMPPGSSTGHESRGLRAVAHRPAGGVGGRCLSDDNRALRQAKRQRGDAPSFPTGPATGSADPTGPPSSYGVAPSRPSHHALGGCHYPAAAGRAPPSFCGS